MAQLGEGESDCSETRSGDDSSRCKATKVAHSQDARRSRTEAQRARRGVLWFPSIDLLVGPRTRSSRDWDDERVFNRWRKNRTIVAQSIARIMGGSTVHPLSCQLVEALQQLVQLLIERFRNYLQGAQTRFLATLLKLRHVILVQPSFLGKINLSPAMLQPQLPYTLPERLTDVLCHPSNFDYKMSRIHSIVWLHPSAGLRL